MDSDFIHNGAWDFRRWVRLGERHVDPYVLWTLQTKFRQFPAVRNPDGSPEERVIDFLVELDRPLSELGPSWPGPEDGEGPRVPRIYREPIPGPSCAQGVSARHITIRLYKKDDPQQLADAVLELILLSAIARAQIGVPRAAMAGEAPPLPPAGKAPNAIAGSIQRAPPRLVLGVLEDGCPFGHAALLSGTHATRVAALWDQSTRGSDGRDAPDDYGYGTHRTQAQLDALLREHVDGGAVDEESLYADPRALQERLQGYGSHAASVVTLLAGRRDGLPTRPAGMPGAADAASRAPLVAVQFPIEQINVAGARWLVVRALDGLRYLCRSAADLVPRGTPPPPLVINVSYGSIIGAHDGTALLETAMDELVGAYGELGIVLAAGNSHGTKRDPETELERRASGCHATGELPRGGDTCFGFYVPPDKSIESYLELWFEDPGRRADEAQFLAPDEVEIEVQPPVGRPLAIRHLPGMAFDDALPENTTAGLIGFPRVAQSRLRSMALLVVAATQISSTRVEVASGLWTVRVGNRSQRALRVQAWVERDLVPRTSRSSQAARLIALPDPAPGAAELTDSNTINNIATGSLVFRAGALMGVGEDPDGMSPCTRELAPSPYTSAARESSAGPELSAVADDDRVNAGTRVSGNTSACVLRMNGTSVAAPQAARWLADELAAGRTVAQVRADLQSAPPPERDARRGRLVP